MVKCLSACNAGDPASIPGSEDPLEKGMAIHSSTLARKIPWMEEPDRLQSMGLRRVGHDWATSLQPMGQIHVRGCFCTACKLRRVFTFLNGWKKKKNPKDYPKTCKHYTTFKFQCWYTYVCIGTQPHPLVYMLSMAVYPLQWQSSCDRDHKTQS